MPKDKDELYKVEQLAAAMDGLPRVMNVISRAMGEEVVGLIKKGFRTETDPYGQRWEPKQIPDGRKTLSGPTSRLKGGWHVTKANKGGFTVAPSVDYAAPHQRPKRNKFGRLKRPRRMMVPDRRKGLPQLWADKLEKASEEMLSTTIRSSFGSSLFRGAARRGKRMTGGRYSVVNKVKSIISQRIRRQMHFD